MENIISSLLNIKELMEHNLQCFNVLQQHLYDFRESHNKMHQVFQQSLDEFASNFQKSFNQFEDQICDIQEEDAVAVEEKDEIKPAQLILSQVPKNLEPFLPFSDPPLGISCPSFHLRNYFFSSSFLSVATSNKDSLIVRGLTIIWEFDPGGVDHGLQNSVASLSPFSCDGERMTSLSFSFHPECTVMHQIYSTTQPVVMRLMLQDFTILQYGISVRFTELTELVGASSSGKTQVCLLATSNVAKKHMGGVVYLDTGNSFSPQRVIDFIRQNSDPAIDQAKHRILQKVMNRILCHSVFDIFTMFDVLHQLEVNLRSQMQKGDCQVRLLIVDSISSLVTPILGGGGSQGHALMTSAGFLLKKLAHEHNLVVLVTNHTVGGEGGISKPALGESWKSIPHVRLRLSHDQGSSIYNVSVFKHPSMVSGKAARFTIYD